MGSDIEKLKRAARFGDRQALIELGRLALRPGVTLRPEWEVRQEIGEEYYQDGYQDGYCKKSQNEG